MINFRGDLWTALGQIGVVLAVLAAIGAIAFWRARRKGSRTAAVDVTLTVSGWLVLMAAINAVVIITAAFTVKWAELPGTTGIWVPWPASVPCLDGGETTQTILHCSGEPLGEFTVANASAGLRALAAATRLTTLALTTLPALMLAVICFQTLRNQPFSRIVTRTLAGGAIAVLVIGVTAELLASIASTVGLREALPSSSEWYPDAFQLTVTPLPFSGAVVLAALAAVFHHGLRLQQEHEALQRDTEGLV